MKAKNVVLALAATGLISTQAYAADTRIEGAGKMVPQAAFSDADMQAMFEPTSAPMQVAALSEKEMKETEGAWWFVPVAAWTVGGAALGAFDSWRRNGTVSWRDVGAGATGGFYASPMGRPFGTVGRFVMGSLGANSWYMK